MEFWNLIKTELSLDLKKMLSYKISFISDIIIFIIAIFSIFMTGLDWAYADSFNTDIISGKILVLIGFIFWQISSTALGWSAANIKGQAMSGTLEVKMQSKFSLEILIFIEMLTYLIISFLSLAIIFMIFVITIGGNITEVLYIPLSYLVAFPGVIGMYGIGLIIGGLSVKEKQTGNLVFIIQAALIFISDLVSIKGDVFNIVPFNLGIKIMRSLYMGYPVEGNSIIEYLIINLIWVLIGSFVFKKFLEKERRNGSFDTY